ncbi:MAG: porin family protein [Cytophagales bacterium]|nr:porin family protein [Cytophagales bacterium]
MQAYTSHIWNKHYIHGRKALIFCLFIAYIHSNAQNSNSAKDPMQETYKRNKKKFEVNLPNYDEKKLHYGFFLGINLNRLNLKLSETYVNDSVFRSVTPTLSYGFALGFLVNYKLADQLSLKLVPSVGFYDRVVTYNVLAQKDTTFFTRENVQTVETTFIELQMLAKYRSLRRKNHRMYIIGGVKPAVRAGGKGPDSGDPKLVMNRFDFSVEYGVGFDFYFPYFKFSPELRFSHGLINTISDLNYDKTFIYNNAITNGTTHTVSIYFFFE